MGIGLQWLIDKITFPSPPSSYSLTSHPELFFVRNPRSHPSHPGVPCMLYAIPQGAPVLVVHAHSNGCDIGDMRQTLLNISESLRVHVMSFEFPGYGLHVGSASMRSIDDTAIAVADFLMHDLRINISQVVWYGRSIGSGPALRMVHRISKELQQQPGGVVLQCGYANFPEVARHLFGRVAKQLVSPLWPNEAMVKELHCPVLLIHGRNDTMIPIEQSEKLWNAVKAKEQSNFHACDCGHNDFNFRRCTLRPIYDFLLGVISAPSFPSSNFSMEISSSSHAFVHHIGPLRSRIPVYSFRRPELEEWLRKLSRQGHPSEATNVSVSDSGASGAAQFRPGQRVCVQGLRGESGAIMNGKQGLLLAFEEQDGCWRLRMDDGEGVMLRPENLAPTGAALSPAAAEGGKRVLPEGAEVNERSLWQPIEEGGLKAFGRELQKQPLSTESGRRASGDSRPSPAVVAGAGKPITPPSKAGGKKAKAETDRTPIADFSQLPAIENVVQALLDPEGMVRTCALRVASFLERLQGQLDRVDGLESKRLEEVVELVEAEFWASDPLLCLWEEVSLPHGNSVRIRLGPFSIDNCGVKSYDPGLGTGAQPPAAGLLRIPLWIFCPSPAHFRCLAEWSVLHSERLERNLPETGQSLGGSGCCCVPSGGLSRKRRRKPGSGKNGGEPGHPTKGVLATSLAAHFVHWVEKTDDVKAIFARFAALYNSPEDSLRGSFTAVSSIRGTLPRPFTPNAASGLALAPKELPRDLPPKSPGSQSAEDDANGSDHVHNQPLEGSRPSACVAGGDDDSIISAPLFPSSPRFFSASSRAMLREGVGGIGSNLADLHEQVWGSGAGREPNICDFRTTADMIAMPEAKASQPEVEHHLDWAAAELLLHYERLLWGAAPSGRLDQDATEEAWGDPMRPDIRKTGLALSKAVKAFAHAEFRERRECQQQGPRPLPRIPQQPIPDSDVGTDGSLPRPPAAAPAKGAATSVEAQPPGVAGV